MGWLKNLKKNLTAKNITKLFSPKETVKLIGKAVGVKNPVTTLTGVTAVAGAGILASSALKTAGTKAVATKVTGGFFTAPAVDTLLSTVAPIVASSYTGNNGSAAVVDNQTKIQSTTDKLTELAKNNSIPIMAGLGLIIILTILYMRRK